MFPTRYLILLSSLICGCSSAYNDLQLSDESAECVKKFVPGFDKIWFTTSIDVTGHHLSGLLLIKKMPDESDRIVFTNEFGVSFFDFEFSSTGFKVIQIADNLNKKAVINTLRDDFELLLLRGLTAANVRRYSRQEELYFVFNGAAKTNYVVTSLDCSRLIRLELGSNRMKLMQIEIKGEISKPEMIFMQHYNFQMQIKLTKMKL